MGAQRYKRDETYSPYSQDAMRLMWEAKEAGAEGAEIGVCDQQGVLRVSFTVVFKP